MAKLFVLFIIVSAAVVSCRRITKRHAEEPNHFYHQYEKTGEMLKSGSSRVPYSSSFDFNYPNDEFSGAESSNFYDIGGPSGLGFNQFSNIGYSSPNIGFGNGYLGGSGFGGNFASGGNYIRPGFYSGGYVQPFGVGYHGSNAGGYVDANKFESAKKNSGDENLQKVDVKVGGSSNEGSQGYNQGAVESTKAKGDAGYYKNETANKNQVGDEKAYQGSQNFDKSGKLNLMIIIF